MGQALDKLRMWMRPWCCFIVTSLLNGKHRARRRDNRHKRSLGENNVKLPSRAIRLSENRIQLLFIGVPATGSHSLSKADYLFKLGLGDLAQRSTGLATST